MKSAIDWYAIKKVRQRRIDLGISQAQLAEKMNISVGFIGMAENILYKAHYNLKHLNELAKILRCSPKDFLPSRSLKKNQYL